MLTGDKLETAENIARSCQLFSKSMNILSISELDQSLISRKFIEELEIVKINSKYKKERGLIIEGEALG